MKRFQILLLALVCIAFAGKAQNVGINDNNSSPNASAMLDVFSASKGLLIPRIALNSINDDTTIVSPAVSLLVYNTSTTTDLTPGYYYWDDAYKWVRLNASGEYLSNMYYVGPASSYKTIEEVIAFLSVSGNMTGPSLIILDGGTHVVASTITINLPYPLTIEGLSYGISTIVADAGVSGTPLFICQTETSFKMLEFYAISNTSGNDGLRFPTSGTYHEIHDCQFYDFNKAIVSTSNHSFLGVFTGAFKNCITGIEINEGSAIRGNLGVTQCLFQQCAIGIHLLSGASQSVSITSNTFLNTISGTDIAVLYVPATFTTFSNMFILGNSWNNQGTYFSGFDFSRTDGRDANAFMINNAGSDNKNPHCRMNVVNNSSTTTIAANGTYYKANWTTTSIFTCKWTMDNNKITYQSNNANDVWAVITGNLSVNVNNSNVSIAIVKNGVTSTLHGATTFRIQRADEPYQFSTLIYIPDMQKDDYLELFVTSSGNGDIVKFMDVQWFTNSQ